MKKVLLGILMLFVFAFGIIGCSDDDDDKNTNANLANLTVSVGELTPAFAADVTNYEVTVPLETDEIEVVATADSDKATVSGDGVNTLTTTETAIVVTVIAEDEAVTMTYTITVTKMEQKNIDLSSLEMNVGTLDPEFEANVTEYTVTVPETTTSVSITADVDDETSTVSGIGTIDLTATETAITITVTADDASTTKTYTITVVKYATRSLRVHYMREDDTYDGWGLYIWGDATGGEVLPWGGGPIMPDGTDDAGVYFDITILMPGTFNIIYRNTDGTQSGNIEGIPAENDTYWLNDGDTFMYSGDEAPQAIAENTIRIHYHRENGDYENWRLWTWLDSAFVPGGDGQWPNGAEPAGATSYGIYFDIPLNENPAGIGFKPCNYETEAGDGGDRVFTMFSLYNEIFIRSVDEDGETDNNVYVGPNQELPEGIVSGKMVSDTELVLTFSKTEDVTAGAITIVDNEGTPVEILELEIVDETTVKVIAALDADKAPYNVDYMGIKINANPGTEYTDNKYEYEGDDLGATLNGDGTATLKIWAPSATTATAIVYDKDDQNVVVAEDIAMTKENSVWTVTLDTDNTGLDDVKGYFYQYEIDGRLVLDPYAKSMAETTINDYVGDPDNWEETYEIRLGANNDAVGKAALVDPSTIGPALDFADLPADWKREDAIIWEIHVRDFTVDPDANTTSRFGTYKAFAEKLDYIKSLGVTHVQLLPVMSYYFGDESKAGEREMDYMSLNANYNWGYDPHSYFAPEGMYSEDPKDPELRIAELKELVKAIHDAGLAVTLDVVYNHTAQLGIFEDIEPNYYYFMSADGTPYDSFGGGQMGTTHAMTRKLIIDSLVYWTEEFKVDGYRFDMMGNMDADTIQMGYDAVAAINPNTLFVGEGWRSGAGDEGEEVKHADQDWMNETNAVACFSDEFRNELKSGFGIQGLPRFLTKGARDLELLFANVKAQPTNMLEDDPGDVLQYIAAHDNLTLHDVIIQSTRLSAADDEEEIHKRLRLGNTIILTSQGTAFLHAGQEYGRTKQWFGDDQDPHDSMIVEETGEIFVENSYNSSDIVNMMDWSAMESTDGIQSVTREYTKGLIAIRKSSDAFRLGTQTEVDANVEIIVTPEMNVDEDLILAYSTKSSDGTDEYVVIVNADMNERTLTLEEDLTSGTVLADDDEASVDGVTELTGVTITEDQITIAPLTATIIKK